MKKHTKILIIFCLIGLSLLLYPAFSNLWNESRSTKSIDTYVEQVNSIDEEEYERMWQEAVDYNSDLAKKNECYVLDEKNKKRYLSCLNPGGYGIMGYIDIPSLGVSLPIYHSTEEKVLQVAAGHIEWSSLPVGGENTHCVISGHRGLPNAKLFTDLDKMRENDIFTLTVFDEVLTYEVDQIRTVLPQEVDELKITKGEDYCTLVTCTPYGINSHRLLVRGHRIESEPKYISVISEAVIIDQLVVAFFLALPIFIILFLIVMLKKPEKRKTASKKRPHNNNSINTFHYRS